MEKRGKQILALLLLGLAVLAIQSFLFVNKSRKTLRLEIPQTMGLGEELLMQVDSLENQIARRLDYEIDLVRNPLELAVVIYGKDVKIDGELEENELMRLSCTIVSPRKNRAILKVKGKSHVVSEGDTILGQKIIQIDQQRMVLRNGEELITLINRPAPEEEKRLDQRDDIDEIAL
jgi:hypothetical protein